MEAASAAAKVNSGLLIGRATTELSLCARGVSTFLQPKASMWPSPTLRCRRPTCLATVWTMWRSSMEKTCHPWVGNHDSALLFWVLRPFFQLRPPCAARFCGFALPPNVTVQNNTAVVRFLSNTNNQQSGFRGYWTTDASLIPTLPPPPSNPWDNITIGKRGASQLRALVRIIYHLHLH